MEASRIPVLAAVASILVMQGCGEQRERHIAVAHCARGELYVRERVQPASEEQRYPLVDLSLYYIDPRGQRVEISASSHGSYRAPTAGERSKTYSTPRHGDWHLFIAPATIDPDGYEMLASCIAHNMIDIRERVAAQAPLDGFGPANRVVPRMATIRYANLADLRKRYECEAGRVVEVREDGLIYLRQNYSMSLLGSVFEDGRSIALDDLTLRYLASQLATDKTTDPLAFVRDCRRNDQASMFQDFAVAVAPDEVVWAKVAQGREHAVR